MISTQLPTRSLPSITCTSSQDQTYTQLPTRYLSTKENSPTHTVANDTPFQHMSEHLIWHLSSSTFSTWFLHNIPDLVRDWTSHSIMIIHSNLGIQWWSTIITPWSSTQVSFWRNKQTWDDVRTSDKTSISIIWSPPISFVLEITPIVNPYKHSWGRTQELFRNLSKKLFQTHSQLKSKQTFENTMSKYLRAHG